MLSVYDLQMYTFNILKVYIRYLLNILWTYYKFIQAILSYILKLLQITFIIVVVTIIYFY
jgi:hypothetical protein